MESYDARNFCTVHDRNISIFNIGYSVWVNMILATTLNIGFYMPQWSSIQRLSGWCAVKSPHVVKCEDNLAAPNRQAL
jgi:hypothetical protein